MLQPGRVELAHDSRDRRDYEPPALAVLGPAEALTLGVSGVGHESDALFPHHSSAG